MLESTSSPPPSPTPSPPPTEDPTDPDLFPPLTRADVLAFQFSAWYPAFASLSIRSTVVRPLRSAFKEWMDQDGIVLPEGSEDLLFVRLVFVALLRPAGAVGDGAIGGLTGSLSFPFSQQARSERDT